VSRRTREFGIRLALGAAPGSLLLFVMREVGWLIAVGAAVGLPASFMLARLAESQLLRNSRARSVDFGWGDGSDCNGRACVAGLAPALRAMRIEPVNRAEVRVEAPAGLARRRS